MNLSPQEQAIVKLIQQRQQPAQAAPKKKGNLLTSLLPTLGGAAGALLGAPLAPFTAGASVLAGGALGSGLGEFGREKLSGEDTNLGTIGRETAFGALPGVGKVLKGGKLAIDAARAGKVLESSRAGAAGILGSTALGGAETADTARAGSAGKNIMALFQNQGRDKLINQADEANRFNDLARQNISKLSTERAGEGLPLPGGGLLSRPGMQPSFASEGVELRPVPQIPSKAPLTPVQPTAADILQPTAKIGEDVMGEARPVNMLGRQSERLFARQSGITPGAKVGSQTLSARRASELKSHVTSIGAKPTDSADTILRRNESYIANRSNDLNQVLEKKNLPFTDSDANSFVKSIKKPVGMELDNNPSFNTALNDIITAAKKGGYKEGEKVRREIDDQINFSRNSASPDPQREQAMLAIRNAWDKTISGKIPDLKPIKNDLSKAYDTKTFVEPKAANPGGFGPFGIKVGGRAMQSAAGVGSKAMDVLGGAGLGDKAETIKKIVGAIAKQGGTRVAAAATLGTPLVGSGDQDEGSQAPSDLGSPDLASLLSGITEEQESTGPTEQEATAQALQMMAMKAAAAGDTEQANAFLAQYKVLADNGTQTADAKKQQAKVQGANSIIDQLAQVFDQAGGAKGPIAGRGELLGAIAGGGNQAAKAYQDMRGAYTAQISRALGEVGVLTDKDREVIQQAIPSVNDSAEAKAIKINTLKNILSDVSSRPASSSGSTDDTTAILQQLGLQ